MTSAALPTAAPARVRAAMRAIWRRHRPRFILVIVLFGASALVGLVPPRLVGALVDRLDGGAGVGEVASFGAAMLACIVVQSAVLFLATRTALVLGEDVFLRLRGEFMAGALAVPMGVVESAGTGELVTRTTQDIRSVAGTVRDALPQSLIAGVTVVLTVAAAVWTSPLIAPVYLIAVTVTLYASALVAPLEQLIAWTDELQTGFVSFARILGVSEIVEQEERVDAGGWAASASREVELRNVRFAYRAGYDVLHEVSLRVEPGERLAVVGPSGAGKSTIARLLAGIDRPTHGRALVGGLDASAIPLGRRRREVMLVSQESHVFAETVRHNVALARTDATADEVLRALQTVGADTWVERLPGGLDTVLGSGGHELTGAQEQHLALARIVLADPHTLILDEATSAMDPTAARGLEAALAAAMEGRTVIAIAHRLYTAHDADRIAVVERGRLVELGPHEDLVLAGGAYAKLWDAWRDDGA